MIALLLLLELVFAIIVIIVVHSLSNTIRDLRYELKKLAGRVGDLERTQAPPVSTSISPPVVRIPEPATAAALPIAPVSTADTGPRAALPPLGLQYPHLPPERVLNGKL